MTDSEDEMDLGDEDVDMGEDGENGKNQNDDDESGRDKQLE